MTRTAGLRGRNAPTIAHRLPRLRDVLLSSLPAPVGPFEYGGSLDYPMACNDSIGDCTIAGKVHVDQIVASICNVSYTYPGDAAVEEAYFGLTGGQDTGLELAQVIQAWGGTSGLLGSRCVAAATIDVHDEQLMGQALYNFGALYVGVSLPDSAEAQFGDEHPWTLGGNETIDGGHCVVLSGVGTVDVPQSEPDFDVVTWGAVTACTDNWWRQFGDEAYLVVTDTMVQSGHDALQTLDLAQMRAAVNQLAALNG